MKMTLKSIIEEIEKFFFGSFTLNQEEDKYNNIQLHLKLDLKEDISNLALVVKSFEGRCIDINVEKSDKKHILIYHFDIKNILLNVKVPLENEKEINSISSILKSISWIENKVYQRHNINFLNHSDIKKIFLDQSIFSKNLMDYLPLSKIMTNTESSKQ